MIYKNNDQLREYLDRGAAGAYREHLLHPNFELDATAFAAALDQVRAQHPGLADGEAEARAVFRLLTSGVPPEIAVPLPSPWFRAKAFARRAATLAWPWLKIAWAVALLLLAAIAVMLLGGSKAHAEPRPGNAIARNRERAFRSRVFRGAAGAAARTAADERIKKVARSRPPERNAIAKAQVVRALTARAEVLAQLGAGGSTAARVQFLSGSAWTSVSSANPLPITCISGCSGGGGGGGGGTSSIDESAFTEGTTAFIPAGGYYKSSFTALTSGQSGSVALTANRAFHVTPYSSGGAELFTSGNAGYVQFPSTPTVTIGNSSIAVTGTFWQTTQPVSWSGQSVSLIGTLPAFASTPTVTVGNSSLAVTGTFWQATQPVSGTFWQSLQPVNVSTWAGGTLGAMANYGTSPGAVLVPGVNAYITNTPTVTVGNSSLAVTGTFWQTTQPVSGTFWQATQPVSCASGATCPVNATLQASSGTDIGKLDANQSVNLAQLNGTALGSPSNYGTSPGAVAVQGVNAFVTNNVQPQPQSTSTYAASAFYNAAVTTATQVKSSGGNLYGWVVYNPNSSFCTLDFYNTSSVTLGTTTPVWSIPLGAGATANVAPGSIAFLNFSTAIYVAAETAEKGSSACGTGMVVNLAYD